MDEQLAILATARTDSSSRSRSHRSGATGGTVGRARARQVWRCAALGIAMLGAFSGPAGGLTATQTATPDSGADCVGDCHGDDAVAVNELIAGVNIALGNAGLGSCAAFDQDANGAVAVAELIAAVNNLLFGCGVMPPTRPPTPTPTPVATDTAMQPPAETATATPSQTRVPTATRTRTATPTAPISVCGGFVSPLPVLCNLTAIPNPVSRSGTIAFRFGVSDLDGNLNRLCLQLTHPPLEPEVTCTALAPTNRLVNLIQTTTPTAASPLLFGTYNAAVQASDAAGNQSNVITATFQVH